MYVTTNYYIVDHLKVYSEEYSVELSFSLFYVHNEIIISSRWLIIHHEPHSFHSSFKRVCDFWIFEDVMLGSHLHVNPIYKNVTPYAFEHDFLKLCFVYY